MFHISHNFDKSNLLLNSLIIWGLTGYGAAYGGPTDLANVPMAVSNMVTPNVLVIYDNSESMDALMNGVMVSGNNANTRSSIGRTVMRDAITKYRSAFNWGLMSYGMMTNPPTLYSTYGYYLGSTSGMVFTSNCTGFVAGTFNGSPPKVGVSTDGGKRCIANPQPSAGREFLTFDLMSDDSNIVDVLYYGGYAGAPTFNQLWAPAANTGNPTTYSWYLNHKTTSSTWNAADFDTNIFNSTLTPTDAGFIPNNSGTSLPNNISRSIYIPRGWGYLSDISGSGALYEPIIADNATHYGNLQSYLAAETTGATNEIKNGAVFTPLTGTLGSAQNYFSGNLGSQASPVTASCQQNFTMLVTDGLPTGKTDGSMYSNTDRTNSCSWSTSTNSCTAGSFGVAASDAINSTKALRTVTVGGKTSTNVDGTNAVTGKYDIQTYVVALGDTVANSGALSVMNAMAFNGGTGTAIQASDATTFANAITYITDNITAKVGSSAAVAVANAHVTSTDNASYASTYNSGTWTGDLNSYSINTVTGVPSTTPIWTAGSAANQLDSKTSSSRYIVTSTDVAGSIGGIQFQPLSATTATKLSSAQQTLLNSSGQTDGAAVVAYLRGDRTDETSGTYRPRAHLLGDIINAEPVLVREPSNTYADVGYAAFKTANSGRTRVVFQGANDGMLHAFVAATGAESWAYVPNLVMNNLNNLSKKSGFTHMYTFDGTPVVADVDFANMSSAASGASNNWRTLLVGGLGKGGRGYYGLDITSPIATSETDARTKILWEFPNSVTNATARAAAIKNMGYSFGKPVVVKTTASGWVVLVTSGYNNGTNSGDSGGDGQGHLFVLDPKTGDLIKDIVTTGCNTSPTSNPCGLAQISAFVPSSLDSTTDYVYGGDIYGNLWRFDFTSNSVGNSASSGWTVSLFTTLKDSAGTVQPISTAPELTLIAGNRLVLVGTGLYLGNTDVSNTQRQTIYGLKDTFTALTSPLRNSLVQQTITTSGSTRTLSSNTVDYATKSGWYVDFPSTGERVVGDPVVAVGALIFTTNIPSATVCQPGGSSWEYFINPLNGSVLTNSTTTWSGTFLGNALASRPVLIQLPSGKVDSLIRTSNGGTITQPVPVSASTLSAKRVTWRELFK